MRIDLSEIARTPGMTAEVDINEPCPQEPELACTAPVKGRISLSNTGNLLLLKGDIGTEIEIECSRCLEDFTMPLESPLEEEFRLEKIGDSIQVLPMDDEDAALDYVTSNILDVRELIRQNLLIALPLQPLCSPDCAGLCPTCGENLNMRKCPCPTETPESPFQALAELLEDDESEK